MGLRLLYFLQSNDSEWPLAGPLRLLGVCSLLCVQVEGECITVTSHLRDDLFPQWWSKKYQSAWISPTVNQMVRGARQTIMT